MLIIGVTLMFVVLAIYLLVTAYVYVAAFAFWATGDSSTYAGERETRWAARALLFAPLWPLALLVLVPYGVYCAYQDAFPKEK